MRKMVVPLVFMVGLVGLSTSLYPQTGPAVPVTPKPPTTPASQVRTQPEKITQGPVIAHNGDLITLTLTIALADAKDPDFDQLWVDVCGQERGMVSGTPDRFELEPGDCQVTIVRRTLGAFDPPFRSAMAYAPTSMRVMWVDRKIRRAKAQGNIDELRGLQRHRQAIVSNR